MPQDLQNIFNNPAFFTFLSALKIIFMLISAFFIAMIIFTFFRTTWFRRLTVWDWREFTTYRPYGVRKLEKQWQKIKLRLETAAESEYKLAIIEADSMLDDILKRMGIGGESLGERFEKINTVTLPNLSEAQEAHKIRNNIVHDPDYRLSLDEAKKTLAIYEKSLSDLQAL